MKLAPWLAGALFALGAAGLAFAVACGGGDSVPNTTVTAKEYTWDSPASIKGGLVKITMKNDGKEPHQTQLVRLNDGVSEAQFMQGLQDPTGAALLRVVTVEGGPNSVSGGVTADATMTLKAGKYYFLCFASGEDGVPHIAKGMVKPLEVTEGPSSAPKPPSAKSQMQTVDYGFTAPDTLPSGKSTIQVTNTGKEAHEVSILELKGITFAQLTQAFANPDLIPPGPPPFEEAGGLAAIQAGATAYVTTDLKSGNYVFLCFLPDAGGTPHFAKGMARSVTVK